MRCVRYLVAGLTGALLGWLIAEPWTSEYNTFRDFLLIFCASLGIALFLYLEQLLFHRRFNLLLNAIKWKPIYIYLLIGSITITAVFNQGSERILIGTDEQKEYRYLVLDTSSSMLGRPLKELKNAVTAYLETLQSSNSQDLVGCIVFSSSAQELVAPTDQYQEIISSVKALRSGGGTNMTEGLNLARNKLSEGEINLPREIVLFTDGDPNNISAVRSAVIQLKEIPIHTIGAGSDYKKSMLREISETTGGQFYKADNIDDLTQVFQKIARQGLTEVSSNDNESMPFSKRALGWSFLGLCIGLAVIFGKRSQEMLPSGFGFIETLSIGLIGGLVGGFLGSCALVTLANLFPTGPPARASGFAFLGLTIAVALYLAEILFSRLKGVNNLDSLR